MSLIASDNCDYDIGDYDCGEESYGYEKDGDYGGYEYGQDQYMDENKGYYSERECEMNDDPSTYSKYGNDEDPCDGSYKNDGACEEYYTSHSEPRGSVRYNPFIYKTYEDHDGNIREDCEVSYSSSYGTSYQSQSGMNGYTNNYSRGCSMGPK
ncbi:secreted protein C-like [Capsicum chacoense]